MFSFDLNATSRSAALDSLASEPVDVLVVGGGATGAGVALDAAARGLRVGLVEARDWASGTSSRSSKLIHGGLRYLYQFNVPLVAEALHERGLLMSRLAPHLVTPQAFLWPLLSPVVERSYSAVGVGAYDMLAFVGAHGGRTLPSQKHYGKAGVRSVAPGLDPASYRGAIRFYDARVDDARLVLAIVRTAARLGARAISHARVTSLVTEPHGGVTGARIVDQTTGREIVVRAKTVVNATGVWSSLTDTLADTAPGLRVRASKGVHLVVPKDCLDSEVGIFLRTDKSVLFIIPWNTYWVIGTTDTPYEGDLCEPEVGIEDIDYVLDAANAVLTRKLTREDVITSYAGLRPLVDATDTGEDGEAVATTKVSREHVVATTAPGLVSVAGGKLTTYRVMAEDTVDVVLGEGAKERESATERLPLVGAAGFEALRAQLPHVCAHYGWDEATGEHLLGRFGDEIGRIGTLCLGSPRLARPLEHAPDYLAAEVVFAVRCEGALTLEDVLRNRIRLDTELKDRGAAAAAEVADLMAPELGWDAARVEREVADYTHRVASLAEVLTDEARATPPRPRVVGSGGSVGAGEGAGDGTEHRGPQPTLRIVTD